MKKSNIWAVSSIFIVFVWIGLLITATPIISFAKPIELKYAILEGSQAARTKHGHVVWADMINKATKGKVKATLFPGGSLAGARQVYDACVNGIIDILYLAIPHYPGQPQSA